MSDSTVMLDSDQDRKPAPKVTVCLPTYNRAGLMSRCLDSILAQTLTDFEVIVSDNCSTDDTPRVVGARRDPRLRYVRNPVNIGVFPNMNQCLDLARGQYICILHDDDLYEPRFLEREAEMLDRHPTAAFVHCATYEIDGDGRQRRLIQAYAQDRVVEGKSEFLRYLGGHNVCCSTVMVRGDLYRKMGGFDTSLMCSDWLMWLKLCLEGDVAYVAEPQASMRVHRDALSSGLDAALWCREFLEIVRRVVALADRACPSLVADRSGLVRRALKPQARRFFIAAVSAMCKGEQITADGFVSALRELERQDGPRGYGALADLLRNPAGQAVLKAIRKVRRAWEARRLSQGSVR